MSTAIAKNFQVGSDGTATNNFTIRQPATPDGTVRIANGNSGTTTDLVTVTSAGNVGIGTSSPLQQLHLSSASATGIQITYQGVGAARIGVAAGNLLTFGLDTSNGTTTRATIDSSGNLGLGVTPSAWDTLKALDIGSGGGVWGFAAQAGLGSNVYYGTGNFRYKATNVAAALQVDGNIFKFLTAPSGTAGNAISFTESMRLDSSGNLGLGVTPSAWNSSSRAIQIGSSGAPYFSISQLTTSTSDGYITWGGYLTGYRTFAYLTTGDAVSTYRQNAGVHAWFNAPSGTAGNAISFTQAMTLTAAGDLGVGTSSPAYRLQVETASATGNIVGYFRQGSGAVAAILSTTNLVGFGNGATAGETKIYADGSSGLITFHTNSTERARITSGGDLLVGVTSTQGGGGSCIARSGNGAQALQMLHTGTDPFGAYINYTGAAPNGTGNPFIQCNDSGALRFAVRSNGGIENYSGNNVNLSDRREKANFAPAKSYLDTICAIPVQTFNYADQNMEEDPGLTLGVVAQDVQAVAPELVMESDWSSEKDGSKMRLSIYQTDLQYALMKALQELKAEFDAYKATHP